MLKEAATVISYYFFSLQFQLRCAKFSFAKKRGKGKGKSESVSVFFSALIASSPLNLFPEKKEKDQEFFSLLVNVCVHRAHL